MLQFNMQTKKYSGIQVDCPPYLIVYLQALGFRLFRANSNRNLMIHWDMAICCRYRHNH